MTYSRNVPRFWNTRCDVKIAATLFWSKTTIRVRQRQPHFSRLEDSFIHSFGWNDDVSNQNYNSNAVLYKTVRTGPACCTNQLLPSFPLDSAGYYECCSSCLQETYWIPPNGVSMNVSSFLPSRKEVSRPSIEYPRL